MGEQDNDRLISEFCDAWTNSDLDVIVESLADDAVYHNIPFKPITGKEAIVATIQSFIEGSDITFETLHQVANGNVVMNERIDTITTDGKTTALPVMGVFEVNDGKITAWRDYFDRKMMTG